MATSPDCQFCGEEDTLLHMCKTCKQRFIPENIRQFPDTTWTTGIHWEAERVFCWVFSRLGFCSPFLTPTMGFSKLVRRCHSHLDFVLSKALPGSPHSVPNSCLGSAFGLRRQVTFGAHLVPASPTNIWAIFIQARLYCSFNLLKGCPRPRIRWVPDWSLCQIPL